MTEDPSDDMIDIGGSRKAGSIRLKSKIDLPGDIFGVFDVYNQKHRGNNDEHRTQ